MTWGHPEVGSERPVPPVALEWEGQPWSCRTEVSELLAGGPHQTWQRGRTSLQNLPVWHSHSSTGFRVAVFCLSCLESFLRRVLVHKKEHPFVELGPDSVVSGVLELCRAMIQWFMYLM